MGGEYPYRTAADIPVEIPPVRRLQARVLLAAAIVAPVRLVQLIWPWVVVNVCVGGPLLAGLGPDHAKGGGIVIAALNGLAALGYGAFRAYRWAVRELEASEKRSDSNG